MMRPLGTAVALALALAAPRAVSAQEAAARLQLLAPSEDAVVHEPDLLLVFSVPADTEVLYRVDGTLVDLGRARVPGDREDLHHARVALSEGRHEIRVLDAADESALAELSVTYIPPYSLRTAALPGSRPYRFHSREREATCSACHSLPEVFETVENRPFSPVGKACGACHPGVDAHSTLHGPVAVYACFMCHEPEYRGTRFRQKSSQAGLCGSCHESFLARILGGRKYVHGPVAAGACLVCHDPHGGTSSALVRGQVGQVCVQCHAETLPLPVERSLHGKMACTACHDPHGGATPVLTAREGNAFCGRCHPDLAGLATGHPIDGHPVSAELDPSRPGKPLGCTSCHGAHALSDISRVDLEQNPAAQKQFCRRCHY